MHDTLDFLVPVTQSFFFSSCLLIASSAVNCGFQSQLLGEYFEPVRVYMRVLMTPHNTQPGYKKKDSPIP